MKKIIEFLKKEIMLTVAVLAAIFSLFITPPSLELIKEIDWHTLGTLFMMLCVTDIETMGFFKPKILCCLILSEIQVDTTCKTL